MTERTFIAGYEIHRLEGGMVKIEGQSPMKESDANAFLAAAAAQQARNAAHVPQPPSDRDDSHDFDDLDEMLKNGVDI